MTHLIPAPPAITKPTGVGHVIFAAVGESLCALFLFSSLVSTMLHPTGVIVFAVVVWAGLNVLGIRGLRRVIDRYIEQHDAPPTVGP
jgi:hypothetical protein